jgi:phosphoribosylformylglycinamidine synthase
LQANVANLIKKALILSAHDCSDGGLFITLFESAIANGLAFDINSDSNFRKDAFLFGEAQGRVVVSVSADQVDAFEAELKSKRQAFAMLGTVTSGNSMNVDGEELATVDQGTANYNSALGSYLS